MSGGTSALRAFMRKEFQHVLRDQQTLAVLLLMPLIQVVLFGFALRTDVRNVRVAFVDPAPDHATLALRARFEGSRTFRTAGVLRSTRELEPLFRRGVADVGVVLAPGLGSALLAGRDVDVLVVSDASDPNTGVQRQAYAARVIQDWQQDLQPARAAAGIQLVPEVRMRYNPTLESVNLFVPGLIALVLTLVSALMTAISLSREKERGTLEILLVSPLRPWQIVAGKVLPYLVLALANVATALVAAWLVFGVPIRGSLTLLVLASMLYAMVSLAVGVLVAAITPSQRAAMLGALLATMLPSTFLSGMVFPIASLPDPMQGVSHLIPARWFIAVARGIMLKGIGLAELWQELAVLAAMLAVFIGLAMRTFKPRLA